MKYTIESTAIRDLISIVNKGLIDLSPSYQRNFIWSKNDQIALIDTILKGYPLPNLFIYKRPDGKLEMVDGQQRTRTIYKYYKGEIKGTGKESSFKDHKEYFLSYKLPIVYISELNENDSLNEFYVLINKKGKPLNIPEVYQAEFSEHPFMRLANSALNYQPFIELGIFSDATRKRMNDRAFTEELLAYLIYGITDKKSGVEQAYKQTELIDEKYAEISTRFKQTIDRIYNLQEKTPLDKTRYRQKNDFYTLFNYVDKHQKLADKLLQYQYRILILLNQKDQYENQFISPSNEHSEALREYAIQCVSQSNSKKAREKRLEFFENILLNTEIKKNETLQDVFSYLTEMYGKKNTQLTEINGFQLINVDAIEK